MKLQRLSNQDKTIKEIIIKGLVQGIGYRPFIAELASEIGLSGFVRNTDGIVTVCANSDEETIAEFKRRIIAEGPSLAKITSISVDEASEEDKKLVEEGRFYIADSNSAEIKSIPYIPPDIATCDSCGNELFDKTNRRYLHPFISCTDCGPRYSIIEDLPYDRPRITMKNFEFCEECSREYTKTKAEIPNNRRRHAQTIACKECGPRLSYWANGEVKADLDDELSLKYTIEALKSGKIVATMDIGGFHLATLASNENAVRLLREVKHRKRKPFAVLFEDTDSIQKCAKVGKLEEELLLSNARPVVLLDSKDYTSEISKEVCVNSPYLGAMLPCNPLQMILVKECGPLVMTSANYSGDLMITDPDEMMRFSSENGGKIEVLYHNRPIITPLDDSVVRVINGKRQTIRRARGYVPEPILVKDIENAPQTFAAGGDMKATFCYYADGKAILSQPFGDMELEEVQTAYKNEAKRMEKLFGFVPERYVCDKHPGYFTRELVKDANPIEIYHHQAHVASVLMERGIEGEAIGLAFDGTGYGTDGTIHGSEFYHWNGEKMHRFASLNSVKLLGGSEGVRNCDTILAGILEELPKESSDEQKNHHKTVKTVLKSGMNTVVSSSMGRLFDATSALLDICHYSEYEGEAAIELEYLASKSESPSDLELEILEENGFFKGNSSKLLEDIKEKIDLGAKKEDLALGFIESIARWSLETVKCYVKDKKIDQIILSGGTFQNKILAEKTIELFEREGFKVYMNEQVSPGDGGIALGQIYLAR